MARPPSDARPVPGQATKARLEEAVRSRFSAAVGSRRHEDVLRYSALFPKLGLQGEGAAQLIAYLRASVAARARADAEALSDALAAAGQDVALQQLRDETAAHVAQAKADSTSLVALTFRA